MCHSISYFIVGRFVLVTIFLGAIHIVDRVFQFTQKYGVFPVVFSLNVIRIKRAPGIEPEQSGFVNHHTLQGRLFL
jgi:hypothetical protein